jgi:Na+/H+ antiporter NhaD/arsenite permease-like protein
MILGEIPGLNLDRTGVALLGAIALLTFGEISAEQAWNSVDVPTIGLLLGLMVVSAQFRLGGFYDAVTQYLAARDLSPQALLAAVTAVAGVLSAALCNDIVCLAMAPILIDICGRRHLTPAPYLLALACASNVGSAATLVGNPQNMLIGQTLKLSFAKYFLDAGPPVGLGLAVVWGVIAWTYRGRWISDAPHGTPATSPMNRWQTIKGCLVLAATMTAFFLAPWPREVVALTAAGVLLCSRSLASRDFLGLVDWHLLVLFIGLFVVNHSMQASGNLHAMFDAATNAGVPLTQPGCLFVVTAALSNLVSNVPAVMLLLPISKTSTDGAILALSSTLSGNLFLVGSIANLIVVDQAARLGVTITWRDHVKIGAPVTLTTLAIAGGWLYLASMWAW